MESEWRSGSEIRDLVAVALAFADPGVPDAEVMVRIVRALQGKAAPTALMDEIKRQRALVRDGRQSVEQS